jgi:hypothetical protein
MDFELRAASLAAIRGVIHAIHGRHRPELVRVDAFKAPDVVTELLWIRAPLMVRVDPAMATEIVFRRVSIELVQPE